MKQFYLSVAFILATFQSFANDKDKQAISNVLTWQATQWNKGSITGFMKGYWDSDSLVFIGKSGPRYGYKTTLHQYKETYPDAAHMGKLAFTIINMKKLSPDYYFVIGTWALTRSAGNVSGYFTLLFRKIKGQWVIVADHSS